VIGIFYLFPDVNAATAGVTKKRSADADGKSNRMSTNM
jgi:hypothetical protein